MVTTNTGTTIDSSIGLSTDTWQMDDVVEEERRLKERNGNHKDGRRPAGELLGVGKGLCNALQRRGLLCC